MDLPTASTSRTMVSTGSLPSLKITNLASSYPFTQQLDVLLAATKDLDADILVPLQNLGTSYNRSRIGLWPFVEYAMAFFDRYSHETTAQLSALPLPSSLSDDTWCIDPTGTLIIQVTKETYEVLGLVGTKLPFKFRGAPEQYVIRVPLQQKAESVTNREREKSAFQAWDQRRQQDGVGEWDVLFSCSLAEHKLGQPHAIHPVRASVNRRLEVHIPRSSIPDRPSKDKDALEDWEEEISELFEWVGLACLGSQRLDVQDRVDPYVAVYRPPTQSEVGDTVHLRWTGLLTPAFVQSVINLILERNGSLASITSHCPFNAPVAYLPTAPKTPPLRVITEDAEATWSVIFVNEDRRDASNVRGGSEAGAGVRVGKWALAETAGKWDMRWG
ncbi:hypothetical protein OE88DRAFT_1727809 [Heliocybe sulcata]|uniref:Uncharacterized protein n=1 Tax=Heliocybe sulcata TaxID=5364 RepID=A0A5C3MXT9_9AGAM|nr:hypothetical protein OE88DRAFT_1727809 [Heliocybe sulcata]